jgi:serine/threonine protein kinase
MGELRKGRDAVNSSSVCPHCGEVHRQSARFCPKTGAQLLPATPPPAPQEGALNLTGKLPQNYLLQNRYLILRKIGQGGMAAVYLVSDTWQRGVTWAIKEMSDAAITNAQERAYAVQSFQQEANLLRSLDHPNLPKVVDAFTEGGKHYLVMEFVSGQTLHAMLSTRTQPFSQAEVLPWAMQLCEVLNYLHTQSPKIIFRDLKPSNIMLTSQGQVKLIDFGIVRFFKPGKTKDTMALGTPGYASPEALDGQTDERSDIYSLCVTMHHLLTLQDPERHMFHLPPVRQFNPAVSPEFERILEVGAQNRRELRWGSASQMRAELAGLIWPQEQRGEQALRKEFFSPQGEEMAAINIPVSGDAAPRPVLPTQAAPPARADAPAAPRMTSRPTTRLLATVAQLSGKQLALFVFLTILILVVATVLLAPVLAELGFNWNQVPVVAIFGALGYAAYPKRGMAFASHTLFSVALVATIWARLGSQGYPWADLLIGALISGAFMEIWVAFLPKVKGKRGQENWLLEVVWISVMAVVGTLLFFGLVTDWVTGFEPIQIIISAILGVLGWFLGDLIQQYLLYRQTGIWRRR